ncbi:MAG: 3'-5' exonuclease [Gloeobacterales cyanobacterium]
MNPSLPPKLSHALSLDPMLVLDVEGSGWGSPHALIEIGAVLVAHGEVLGRYSSLVRYRGRLNPMVTKLTGLHQDDLVDAPKLRGVLTGFSHFAESAKVLIGHGLSNDLAIVRHSYEICLMEIPAFLQLPTICTVDLAPYVLPHWRRRSLSHLALGLSVPQPTQHRALEDAETTTLIYYRFKEALAGIVDLSEVPEPEPKLEIAAAHSS